MAMGDARQQQQLMLAEDLILRTIVEGNITLYLFLFVY